MSAVSSSSPRLSVVIVTIDGFETVRRLMEYLAAQTVHDQVEIVLVCPELAALHADRDLLAGFHSWQTIEFGPMPSVQEPRFAGVAAARAPVVVFTEDHCFPDPDWAASLLAAYEAGDWTGVAPSVGLANPATFRAWANYLIQYGPWVQPAAGGELRDLPGHNSSFRRSAFDAYQGFDESMVFDSVFHAELHDRGARFRLEPRARTYHVFMTKLVPFLAENYHIGRQFAGTRCRRWPAALRAAWVLGATLIPVVRMARIFVVMRRQRWIWPLAIGAMPSLVLGLVASAAGEALGYAAGVGGAAARTLQHDFRRWRAVQAIDRALWMGSLHEFAYDPPRPRLPSPLEMARAAWRDLREVGWWLGTRLFGRAGDPDELLPAPSAVGKAVVPAATAEPQT